MEKRRRQAVWEKRGLYVLKKKTRAGKSGEREQADTEARGNSREGQTGPEGRGRGNRALVHDAAKKSCQETIFLRNSKKSTKFAAETRIRML